MFWLFWLMVKVKGLVAVLCAVVLRAMLPGLRAFAGGSGAAGVEASEDTSGTRPAHRPVLRLPVPRLPVPRLPVPRPALHSRVPLTAAAPDTYQVRGRSRSASGGEDCRFVGSIRSQRSIHHYSFGLGSDHVPARSRRVGVLSVRLMSVRLGLGGVRMETATAA